MYKPVDVETNAPFETQFGRIAMELNKERARVAHRQYLLPNKWGIVFTPHGDSSLRIKQLVE